MDPHYYYKAGSTGLDDLANGINYKLFIHILKFLFMFNKYGEITQLFENDYENLIIANSPLYIGDGNEKIINKYKVNIGLKIIGITDL